MCVPIFGKHIALVICPSLPGKHISLEIYVHSTQEHISVGICVPLPGETHIPSDNYVYPR